MHEYKNSKPDQNASTVADDMWQDNKTTEFTWSPGFETVSIHHGIDEDDMYTGNKEDTKMAQTPESNREAREITDATNDVALEFHNKALSMGDVKTGSDLKNTEHDLSQGKQRLITKSPRAIHLKKYMKFKKTSLENTDEIYQPMARCQPKIEEQSKNYGNQEGQNTSVDDEEQSSCPKPGPMPDVDNVSYKSMCSDGDTNGRSKRNSYERLNKDTMEPHDKVCQCKAHPGRTRSREYRITWESKTETSTETCSQTSPMNQYIEAICQRTAAIMLHQLRSKSKPNEPVKNSQTDKHVDGKVGVSSMVGALALPNKNDMCGEHMAVSFDQGDLQSSEQMKTIGQDNIPYESGCHQSQYPDICEASFCNISTHHQSGVEKVTERNEEEVEGAFCQGRGPTALSGIEDNVDRDCYRQQEHIEKQSSEKKNKIE